jgi:DNA-binding transcriptional LysR family regulator
MNVQKSTVLSNAMNWDDLRFFLALSREGAVSRAGKSLGVNHTTVARRISAFETQIGTRLFDRTADGYEMTQAAENMYDHALQIEEQMQAIDRDVFGQDAELKGPLKITISHDVADRLLIPRLAEFRERYPCIDVDILTTKGIVDLTAREADIAVRLTAKPPDFLIGREVLPLRHGIYAAEHYSADERRPTDVILFRGNSEMPQWVVEHFPDARIALQVDDVGTMLEAVKNGVGLARMPCYVGDFDAGVRRFDLPLTPSDWGVWVLSHVDLRCTARVRVAREFLIEIIKQQRELVLGESSRYFVPEGDANA